MRFTIFTPTFNRAYIIQNLYKSLCRQTFKDFEWIIVDDGSTDNTEHVVGSFIAKKPFFPIIYIKTKNGGKHRAWNIAVKHARGELFSCCDSDDYYLDNALEIMDKIEKTIPQNQKKEFQGIQGLRIHHDGKTIGTTFENGEFLDISLIERRKNNIYGDRAGADYTHVLKQFPFPEIDGENFLTEDVCGFKIAASGYKVRFFNQPLKVCEYRQDGLTKSGNTPFVNNPKGWALYINSLYDNKIITKREYCWKVSIFHNDLKIPFREKATLLEMTNIKLFIILGINRMRLVAKKALRRKHVKKHKM